MIQFVSVPVTLDAAAGEDSPRTITGVAVPWDTPATVSSGESVMFKRGAFDVNAKAPKLIENHDMTQLRGVVVELADDDSGLLFTAKFAKTRAADEAIELVKAGAYDSVSVGAIPVKYKFDKNGTMVVSKANLVEISLVAQPAFADAVITEIAASQPEEVEEVVEPQPDIPEEETVSQETPAVEASAEIVPTAPIVFASAKREVKLPTAAEYIAAAMLGGDAWHEMSAALKAAAPDVVTSDTPGILPLPIVQPVYNNFRGLRPVVDAIGPKAMPGGGKVFIRPEVTTHVSMAAQSAENAALQSGTFVVSENQVTKGTYGGYVNLSLQDLEWSQPEVLQLILDDMGRIYANTTDNVAADNLLAGVTQSAVLTDPTSPSEWVADIFAAASTILSNSNGNLPTHLFLSPNMWASLGQLVDTAGRPLFPQVGPMNAFGTVQAGATEAVAFGLRVVVDRNFAADTVIVGDASGFEIFEQQKGALSLESPSTLSRTLSFHGYFATLMIDNTKFVKLT
jgi:HK97 family phage prohead protease